VIEVKVESLQKSQQKENYYSAQKLSRRIFKKRNSIIILRKNCADFTQIEFIRSKKVLMMIRV